MWMDSNNAYAMDFSAISIAIAAFFGWLPNIAALLTVIWMGLRVYEAILIIQEKRRKRNQEQGTSDD